MPSPFPGMNPYLEQEDAWHDFHERFMPFAAELIAPQVGPNYIVKIDENVYIHELDDDRRFLGRGDVFVAGRSASAPAKSATAILVAPLTVSLPAVDVQSDGVIEIIDRRNRQVVTVIELLSPSNKNAGPDREQYLAKRGRILSSATHFVEIDLLRGGPRMPMTDLPPCDYCVLVSCSDDRPRAGVWPIRLRDPLPEIPVPLRAGDTAPRLDLLHAIHRVYDAAQYEKYIYDTSPFPPLSSEDFAWARSFLPSS